VELVDVTLTPLQSRTGAVWLPWRELAAQQLRRGAPVRPLAPGDDVMLRIGGGSDEDGETGSEGGVRRGWVLRNANAGRESAYVIVFGEAVGRRIPLSTQRRPEARTQIVPQPRPEPRVQEVRVQEVRVQEVRVRRIPAQRAPWDGEERRRVNLYL